MLQMAESGKPASVSDDDQAARRAALTAAAGALTKDDRDWVVRHLDAAMGHDLYKAMCDWLQRCDACRALVSWFAITRDCQSVNTKRPKSCCSSCANECRGCHESYAPDGAFHHDDCVWSSDDEGDAAVEAPAEEPDGAPIDDGSPTKRVKVE